ncbi:hypothetical protein F5887DRAFT_1027349 [Amanita rubescens]|nr:hypothetical protein F5887DRAFT_1027349 [Amanita rubescens]
MVKFTFCSIFLILASVFALVSAVPTASSFRISNFGTGRFISSNGTEQAGDSISTIPFTPGDMLLSINPPPAAGDAVTFSTVKGKAGLYITAQIGGNGVFELVWQTTPRTWKFILERSGVYLVYYMQDNYWGVSPDYSNNLILENAHSIVQNEVLFNVIPV